MKKLKLPATTTQLSGIINKSILLPLIFVVMTLLLSGCGLVEGIFEAGFWLGIIVSVLIIVLIIWGIVKVIKKLKS